MRNVRRILGVALVLGAVGLSAVAEAGEVALLDGKKLEGVVTWTAEGKISVAAAGKAAQVVELKQVASARFDAKPEVAKVAGEWLKVDLGGLPEKLRGTLAIVGASGGPVKVTVRDTTYGFKVGKRATDNCLFAYQVMDGDLEAAARVMPKDETVRARGGVMVRESTNVDGPMVMVARGGEWGGGWSTVMLAREGSGERTEIVAEAKRPIFGAGYVKVVRKGDTFTGFDSPDGKTWTEIASKKVRMTDARGVMAGVASSGMSQEGHVVFDKVTVAAVKGEGEDAKMVKRPDAYLMTKGGSVIAGEADVLTDKEVKLMRNGAEVVVPLRFVSRMVYLPMSRETRAKMEKMGPGILTREGDVLEGEVKEVQGDVVRISSVVFGLTRVEQRKIAAIALQDVSPTEGEWTVWLQDGSVMQARGVTGEKGKIVVEDAQAGNVGVGLKDVVEIVRKK